MEPRSLILLPLVTPCSYLHYGTAFPDPVASRHAVPTSITFYKEPDFWYISVGHLTMLSVAALRNVELGSQLNKEMEGSGKTRFQPN
jgi:hypothetical protein